MTFLTVKEVAEVVRVSEEVVMDAIKKGVLASYRFGEEPRISQEQFDAYLKASITSAEAKTVKLEEIKSDGELEEETEKIHRRTCSRPGLADLLAKKGFTDEQFADLAGVCVATVRDYLNDGHIRIRTRKSFTDAIEILKTKPDRLVSGEAIEDLRSRLLVYMHNNNLSARDIARKVRVSIDDIEIMTVQRKGINPKVRDALRDLLEGPVDQGGKVVTNPQDLQQAIKAAGYNVVSFSKKVEVSDGCVWNWIAGKSSPNPSCKKRLVDALAEKGVEFKESWIKARYIYPKKSDPVVQESLPEPAPHRDLRTRLRGFMEFLAIDTKTFAEASGTPEAAVKFFVDGGNLPSERMQVIQNYLDSFAK